MKAERGKPYLQSENTIAVPVTYYFEDGSKEEIEVAIFVTAGMTVDDVETAIKNRGESRQNDLNNAGAAKELLQKLLND